MPEPVAPEDEVLKEMYGGTIHRVDAVKGPASRMKYVVLKSEGPQDPAAVAAVTKTLQEAGVDADTIETDPDAPAEPVAKAEELDAELATAAAGDEAPTDAAGDPADPDSAAWEAVDAARARQALNMAIGLQRLVQASLDRETTEAVLGDPDDIEAVYDLSDVLDAIESILDTLAPFALGEECEAEERDAELVTKAGRVLSGTNEAAIRSAMETLQGVIASLPAPTVEEPAQPADQSAAAAAAQPEETPVAKADDAEPMLAVYSADGQLLGACDPAALTPLTTSADDDHAEPVAVEPDPELAPAPEAEAAPVEPVAKSEEPQPEIADVVEAAVTKALEAAAQEHTLVLKALEERLAVVEAMPAPGGPLLSGATGTAVTGTVAGLLASRGQTAPVDPEMAAVHKQLAETDDPVVQADLRRQQTFLAMRQAYKG